MTAVIMCVGLAVGMVFISIGGIVNMFQIEHLHSDVRRLRLRILILEERLDSV